jgi:integrase
MAHIEKRGPHRWRARYRGPDGRERSRTFERRADAEKFLTTTEADKLRGSWVEPSRAQTRFGDFVEEILPTIAHLRPGTRLNFEGRLRNHVLPFFADLSLAAIRPNHVRAWVAELSTKDLAPATVNAAYRTLHKILRFAENDGLIARSPCIAIDLPKESSHEEMRFLDAAEVTRLADAIEPRYRALIYTAAYSGMRWGELAALKLERLNLLRGTVDVAESQAEVNGHLHIGPTKSGARRTVTLPRFLTAMLAEHLAAYPSTHGERVFSSSQGLPLRRNFYRRQFKTAVIRAGLDPALRFHDLRHTCVALLIAQGAHAKEIQEHLGHSTIRLTFDRYGHVLPQRTEQLREGLDRTYADALAASPRPGEPKVTFLNAQEAP